MNINSNAHQIKPRVFPRPNASMGKAGNGYIVMPPKESSLFKSEGVEAPTLDSFGVENSEKLDVVGGYLAELNPAQVRDMKRQGYQVFKDEVKSYIPNQEKLDMNALAEDAIAKAEAAIEKGELPETSRPPPPRHRPSRGRQRGPRDSTSA